MRSRRRRLVASLLAVGLFAVLLVGVQAGHRVSRALVQDRHMFFTADDRLDRVDGDSGQVDGSAPNARAPGAEVTQPPSAGTGPGYLTSGSQAFPYDPLTMKIEDPHPFSSDVTAVPGNKLTYFLEPKAGQVSATAGPGAGPGPGAATSASPTDLVGPVEVKKPWIDEPVVDGTDTLWLLAEDGKGLVRVAGGYAQRFPLPGEPATALTLVGDRPVVLAGSSLRRLRDDGSTWDDRSWPVRLNAGGKLLLAEPSTSTPATMIWMVERATAATWLIAVDLGTGQQQNQLVAATDGGDRPAVAGDVVYVPVSADGYAVHLYEASSLRPRGEPVEVAGKVQGEWDPSRRLELLSRHGQVWAHVRDGEQTILFDPASAPAGIPVPLAGDAPVQPGGGAPGPTGTSPTGSAPATPVGPSSPVTTGTTPPAPRGTPPDGLSAPGPRATRAVPAGPGPAGTAGPASPPTVATSPASLRPVRVPDVVGEDRATACADLARASLACVPQPVTEAVAGAGSTAPGSIQRTNPAKDTSLAQGSEVTVFYLTQLVPDLRGQSYTAACGSMPRCTTQAGTADANAYTAAGVVYGQTPDPGTELTADTAITLTYYTRFPIPDLRGQPGTAACAAVQAVLTCTTATGPADAIHTPGTVVAQDQQAGTVVDLAARPALALTLAGTPVVPQVVGLTPDAACAAVQQAGLTCVRSLSPNRTPDSVFQQNPPAGTEASPSAAVTVSYWTVGTQQLTRLRRTNGERVWLLHGDGNTDINGYAVDGTVGVASANTADPAAAGFLSTLDDLFCPSNQCGYQNNHYITTDQTPPGPASVWSGINRAVGWVFNKQYTADMVPVVRLSLQEGSVTSWAYAISGSSAYNAYTSSYGFGQPVVLGWVWPS